MGSPSKVNKYNSIVNAIRSSSTSAAAAAAALAANNVTQLEAAHGTEIVYGKGSGKRRK